MNSRSILFMVALTVSFYFINNFLFPPAPVQAVTQAVVTTAPTPAAPSFALTPASATEEFYVLENAYQQLVFSSQGGALAEVNLPFSSKENPKSVVKKIGFDRMLEKEYSQYDHFPKHSFTDAQGKHESVIGGYYPLLRRDSPLEERGLAITSEDPTLASMKFQVKRLEKDLIELEGSSQNRRITKTIAFPKDADAAPYCFDVTIKIEGESRGLWMTTGVPEVEIISGASTPTLKFRLTRNQKPLVEQVDLPKASTSFTSFQPDWVCNSNGFLGIILDPRGNGLSGFTTAQIPGEKTPTRLSVIDAQYQLFPATKYPGYAMRLPLNQNTQSTTFRVFAGPFATNILKRVDTTYSDPKTGYTPDFIACQSFHGWFSFISEPFAKFLFFLMNIFHTVTHSWGLSIILLTVALRIMLYPLNAWSLKSTAKMQKIAPKVSALQEKYKKEPKKAQLETMALYREHGVNPLGGCLPLLIQMPFLIGMFDLLKSTFELRGASFIPGWIDNLTAPDVLFSWNYPIWFFGTSFHLLPLILGGVMFLQQRMAATGPKDVNKMTDQQRQQRFMGNIMVVVFAVLFYHFPSGLNLYWLSSMLLGILQQWWTTKNLNLRKKGT